ncbi:MAG TPA: DUF2264 domain-containing protein [Longimicrobiaceae bacterium]|nr:DUF2264 domain-containing protein [Longimicrobiaceae bacterium]
MIRRSFLKQLGALGLVYTGRAPAGARDLLAAAPLEPATGAEERAYWVAMLTRVAEPVLTALSRGELRARMPVEVGPGGSREERAAVTHLEAFGRTMAGLAPWLELGADSSDEGRLRARFVDLAHRALSRAVDPASPDFLNFSRGRQPLVDAAFLSHAVLRAPRVLQEQLDSTTRGNLVRALKSTRTIVPYYSNWLLFSGMVEAALLRMGEDWDRVRVDLVLRKLSEWYLGDGLYGDGPEFHWDYYNSYVIQPFLLDILRTVRERDREYARLHDRQLAISRRYGAILERLIAPDGSYPPIGRSLAYRCGAFQLLAQLALEGSLPESLPGAQVRSGIGAVIRRTLGAPKTFDAGGWLRIGLAGAQPQIAESYISTGSLYLCTVGFLPLGLPPTHAFWTDPPARWTSLRAWSGEPVPRDHALEL